MGLRAPHHPLSPPILDDGFRGFRARPVETIERARRKVAIELRAIGRELRLETVEDFLRQAPWIRRRLYHERRHRADDGRLGHSALAMPSQIMDYLAAAGGVTDMHRILQVEMRGHRREI